eukprot:CAMPEP_0194033594 /NCGR_PEP_ID=MMETSP0009_2-20130614/6225_1 /TAXON_ID=210454 /ORGANISM="Grammatophora oceanica, Strain CCMP 410" /LENGTH=313 /DNA_ID=CAMNT_0038674309 /DNA_START=72 /DNA_END=1013 /DNA_ORIENTATION=-
MRYAIVTGASQSSIGFLAAKSLASPPHSFKVILACRSDKSGQASESAIKEAYPEAEVVYVKLDLASFDSIRAFVTALHEIDDGAVVKEGLSLLVCNAGVAWSGNQTSYAETSDGLEEIVGVNHFGHFLLTQLLMDDIKKAPSARVVLVASSLHDLGKDNLVLPDFPDGLLQTADKFDGMLAYRASKLCNIWFAYELQRKLSDSDVVANAVSPGFIPSTGLSRNAGAAALFFLRYVLDPLRRLGIGPTSSPEDGAKVIVDAATSESGDAKKGGMYLRLKKDGTTVEAVKSSAESYDEDKAAKLWELSKTTCKLD